MERVQHVRELEKTVKDDVKNVNNMIAIRQVHPEVFFGTSFFCRMLNWH
jgi:hypothetical protein